MFRSLSASGNHFVPKPFYAFRKRFSIEEGKDKETVKKPTAPGGGNNERRSKMTTTGIITKALIVAAAAAVAPVSIAASHTATAPTAVVVEDSDYAFDTYVANTGEQDAVDACAGGVTYMPSVAEYVGKAYYPIHNYCGGTPILSLENGDQVRIDDVTYTVVGSVDVQRGDDATAITNLPGTALLQTCYENSNAMRVVAISANA